MKITEITKYRLSDELIYRKNGDVLMVYNKSNGDMYEINHVGMDIFDNLINSIPISDMLDNLADIYSTKVEDILEDVTEFIERMIELDVMIID